MTDDIGWAIRERLVLTFWYDGHNRVVIPATLGLTSTGKPTFRGYQTGGTCKHGTLPQWKLFTLSKIIKLSMTAATFSDPPQYRRGDRGFARIYAEL